MDSRRYFGDQGEALAAKYLQDKGYKIFAKQYKTFFGEIDLVCFSGTEVVFVEVKSRRTNTFGYPEDSVHSEKIQRILRSVYDILNTEGWYNRLWRVDVIAIEFHQDLVQIRHIQNIDIPDWS